MPHDHRLPRKGVTQRATRNLPLGAMLLGLGLSQLTPAAPVQAAEETVATVRSQNGEPWTISIRPARKASDTTTPRQLQVPAEPAPLVKSTIRQVAALSSEPPASGLVSSEQATSEAGPTLAEPALPAEGIVEQAKPRITPAKTLPDPPEPGPEPVEAPKPAPVAPKAETTQEPPFSIQITPGPSRSAPINGQSYSDVYRSIPFNRAEYNANPGYRHDATMEVLFGQMRPTTIIKHQPSPVVNEPPAYSPYKPFIPAYGDYWSARALPLLRPFFPFNTSSGDFSFRTTLPGADFPGGVRQGSALPPIGY